MTAIESLCRLLGWGRCRLSRNEKSILEAYIFVCLCRKLEEILRAKYEKHFCSFRYSLERESMMLEDDFARLIIEDILSTNEYTLLGIACYTYTSEEVVENVLLAKSTNPSALFLRRLIELHYSVRKSLYLGIIKKSIIDQIPDDTVS